METLEIINEINRLPIAKRIYVLEKTLNSIRKNEESESLNKAAKLLFSNYVNDDELTAFSSIDFEDFYETK